MYVYSDSVNDMLKSAFIYSHTGQFPLHSSEVDNSLFSINITPVNSISWSDIFLLNPRFQSAKKEIQNSMLIPLVLLNLRYSSDDKHSLIIEGLKNAIENSVIKFCSDYNPVFTKLTKRKNCCLREVHKMLGLIRFTPVNHKLAGVALLEHNTADLILYRFRKRYPKEHLVLLVGSDTVELNSVDEIIIGKADNYIPFIKNDDFTSVWKKYYESQYIPSRKNLKLLQHHIPKKYWNWLTEGDFIKSKLN
ncbi:DUF4130 domain-containing protein [Proteinivorax tanatarense]|uniref:DUF4130 domain-containing protein n=1 Tax=Proteinivorax tanatarense TaxID=1260629 RepID=A0AAU7VPT6_9FIRM